MMGSFNEGADRARVLIADNAELFRLGLQDALAHDERFASTREVARVEDVHEEYVSVQPDVAVIACDDAMRAMSALRSIRQLDPRARVVVLITLEASSFVLSFVRAGAQAVLLRDAPIATVRRAIVDVCDGGAALDGRLAQALFEGLAATPVLRHPMSAAELDPRVTSLLSGREREVLQALTLGYRNKQIGAELGVSVGTVKTHLRHIFRKLHVTDRTGAVLKALDVLDVGLGKAA